MDSKDPGNFLERQMRGLSARGAGVSAVLILLVGFLAGFYWAKSIYQDQANHWKGLYETGQTRRGLSDKNLKVQALEVADRLSDIVTKEREASGLRVATHSAANILGFSSECDARRADAKGLRDEILQRVAAVYRDSAATMAYQSGDCVSQGPTVVNDLRSLARKLPD